MNKDTINESVNMINCALDLERKVTAVKFLFTREEFENADAIKIKGKIPYCVMVKSAMAGKGTKAEAENFACNGAAKALGIVEPDQNALSGNHYKNLGLHQDLTTAKSAQSNTTFCTHKNYGIMVKPLEEFNESPDVVLIVSNTYNLMRIMQGYTYVFGYNTSIKMSGNQAVCSECTAFPFESNNINVSLFCSGTRYNARWGENELITGFPFNRFTAIVGGVVATLDSVEPDDKKKKIEKRFNDSGLKCPEINYNRNYFTPAAPE